MTIVVTGVPLFLWGPWTKALLALNPALYKYIEFYSDDKSLQSKNDSELRSGYFK